MCGFYCIAFIKYILAGKILFDYTNSFSPNDYKKMTKKYISTLKINMVQEASLEFRLRETDETGNYLLNEIKHNDSMNQKYEKKST